MKLRFLLLIFLGFITTSTWAQMVVPSVQLGLKSAQSPKEVVGVLQVLVMLTVLSLAPAILIMMTSFTRIIVILSFLRQALGTNNMPPNQLLVGLALFLTFVVMGPTLKQVNENALQPFLAGKISQMEGLEKAKEPVKAFMLKHVRPKDLDLMASLTEEKAAAKEDISFLTLVPAFLISELKTSFQIGFIIYLPFLILDMVVASVLMAMGMMMLPPVIISLPFKLMLFVLVDGWQLIVGSIVKSFG
ncbi:MAG: flagellar type III secretion system pore protein FliP [Proteobacteria bacterium]|nr:flagellar type III secretion system pore protein FliP [Pseudomonadota bacterium]